MKKILLALLLGVFSLSGFTQVAQKDYFILHVNVTWNVEDFGDMSDDADWFITAYDTENNILIAHNDYSIITQDWVQPDSEPGNRHYKVKIYTSFTGYISIGGQSYATGDLNAFTGAGFKEGSFGNNQVYITVPATVL
ncbi:MAG: hypothetical protein JEZ03_15135 [Bacteroidales bacterium]|nr:hypothetical protein [Bacteroidales bacterium]